MNRSITRAESRLKTSALIMIALLSIQFFAGIFANLYVDFPKGVDGMTVVRGSLALSVHLALAVLIELAGLAFLIASIVFRRARWIIASAVGFAAILFSITNGFAFVESAGTHDLNSFLMATGFIVSLLAYFAGIAFAQAKTAPDQQQGSP